MEITQSTITPPYPEILSSPEAPRPYASAEHYPWKLQGDAVYHEQTYQGERLPTTAADLPINAFMPA